MSDCPNDRWSTVLFQMWTILFILRGVAAWCGGRWCWLFNNQSNTPIVCSLYARAQRSAARTKPTHPNGTSNRSQAGAHACPTLKTHTMPARVRERRRSVCLLFFLVENAQQIRLGKFDGSSRRPLPRTLCLCYYIKIVCIYAVKSHTHLFILLCVMCMGLCLCCAVYGTVKPIVNI